jgi:hypothetical protein
MIRELDAVALHHDISEHGLLAGDLGVVVIDYGDDHTYEVEFMTADGNTVALLTLTSGDIGPVGRDVVRHSRPRGDTTISSIRRLAAA